MPRQCSPNYNHITSDHTHLSEGDRAEDVDGRKKKEQREKKTGRSNRAAGKKNNETGSGIKVCKADQKM